MLNKFSKAGYHNRLAIKYGEIFSLKNDNLITKIARKKLKP